MNQTFCSAAKLGDRLIATGTVNRYGRTMGFTTVQVSHSSAIADCQHLPPLPCPPPLPPFCAADAGAGWVQLEQAEGERVGTVVALGRHTKVFPS